MDTHKTVPSLGFGMPTDRDRACFEAGITLGALYHQFSGTPVSEASRPALERAIEESFVQQIGVESLDVAITDIEANTTRFGYAELEGPMLDVDVVVEADGVEVEAGLELTDGYPMMGIETVR